MPLKRYNVMQNTLSSFYTQAKMISLSITKPQVSQDPTGHICIRLSVQKKKSNDEIEISFLCFVSMLALAFIRLFLFCSTEHTGSWLSPLSSACSWVGACVSHPSHVCCCGLPLLSTCCHPGLTLLLRQFFTTPARPPHPIPSHAVSPNPHPSIYAEVKSHIHQQAAISCLLHINLEGEQHGQERREGDP